VPGPASIETSAPAPPAERAGLLATLRAALNAGLLAGCVVGIADGIVAGIRTGPHGALDWLGCLAASSVVYGIALTAVALALAVALHPWLRVRPLGARVATIASLTLGLALFLDLYWWTRPWLFYGLPATDPKRLAVAAVLLAAGLALGFGAIALGRKLPRAALWGGAVLVVLTWLGGLGYLAAVRARAGELGKLNERNRRLPNVLLVINDAMRADVLGCYGNERVKTPRIDRLAAEGVVFERAYVQAPYTGTSFGSFFTGKYPRRHGFVKMDADTRMASNVTLASHLKSAELAAGGRLEPGDYHCVTFMTGALSQAMGLMRGFDTYYEAFLGHELVDLEEPWSVFRSELVLSIAKSKVRQRFEDAPAAAEAVRWLRDNGDKRFFAMVHTFSTHTPYDPPDEFREMYCDPAYRGPVSVFRSDHRQAIEEGHATPAPADVEQIRNLYYGGVSHADRQLEEVLAELERQGVLQDTLVIVTSDHGEELGEHGVWEHNYMFQTNLHVPLVVAWPRAVPGGVRVGALVESIDVVPTVCDLIGLAPPFEERFDEHGRNYGAVDGKSLAPLIRGERGAVKEFSFSENGTQMSVQDLAWKLVVPVPEGELAAATLESLAAHPVYPARLFDLANDPGETRDLLAERTDEARRLLAALAAWDASMPIPRADWIQSELDRRYIQSILGQLGYGEGIGQDPSRVPRGGGDARAPDDPR
jgi:arylsulfatase